MEKRTVEVGGLKAGDYVIIEGEPCRVVGIRFSAPGKHGAAKARIEAIGLFDNKKRAIILPADERIEAPIINKRSAQVLSSIGDKAQLMDLETYETFELEVPEELRGKIKEGAEALYWEVLGRRVLKEVRG